MIENPQEELKQFKPQKQFFIGIDSDGCAFDTMEIKQKECFCPNFIKHFELQKVQKYAREIWEFVNLYSKTRGVNRFLAVIEAFRQIKERDEVQARGFVPKDIKPLIEWTEKESKLGIPALEQYASVVNDEIINVSLNWAKEVNKDIAEMVYGMPPFPWVRESLEKIQHQADSIVVSQTPLEALVREWEENDIDKYVRLIAGQEYGKKSEHIALTAKGKYPDNNILMVGDAPGDLKAAKSNSVLFYPIIPGEEESSWEHFYKEVLDKFFAGEYDDQKWIDKFEASLPEKPPWKR